VTHKTIDPEPESSEFQHSHPTHPDTKRKARQPSVISVDSTLPRSSPPKKRKRRPVTLHPSQGDAVLISFLAPDQYDLAIDAGLNPLSWPSESEYTETEMEGGSGGAGMDGSHGHDVSRRGSETELKGTDKHEQTNGDASRNVTPTAGEQSSSLAIDPALSGANEAPAAEGLNGQEANQPQINDAAIDPALVKQEAPDETMTDADGVDLGGSSSETAASLITLAGGAVSQYLSASFAGAGVNGTNWTQGVPASPDSPNKQYTNNMSPSLPSMMGHEGSPTNRDGKHTTLPPINSIDVLAELATKQDSPQQAQGGSKRGSYMTCPQSLISA
jgi:hypothetical protein